MTMSSGHCRWRTARPFAGLLILALSRLCGADCVGASPSCAATGASLLALKAETHAASLGDLEEASYPINMTVNGSNGTVDVQLEMIVGENAEQDMKEMNSIPNPENASSNGTHGMGELARNLEFLMLKIVQLETVVEMQQHEIQDLRSVIGEHFDLDHNDTTASLKQVDPEARTKKAQETLKKVMQKHNHQREKRDFSPEAHRQHKQELNQEKAAQQRKLLSKRHEEAKAKDTVLLEAEADEMEETEETERSSRRRGWPRRRRRLFKAVSNAVSSAGNAIADTASDVAAAANDGTGLVGDALGDAYEHAADQVTFVANTVIDSVEMAVDILIRGFSDWNAGCPDTRMPDMQISGDGLRVDWGRQKCWVRLMGQTCNLFDFNFGTLNLNWPEPLKTVIGFGLMPIRSMFNLGADLVDCATSGSALEVVKCLGFRLIEVVPPLSMLTRMSDMLTEFIV